jgi:hypothetical protein
MCFTRDAHLEPTNFLALGERVSPLQRIRVVLTMLSMNPSKVSILLLHALYYFLFEKFLCPFLDVLISDWVMMFMRTFSLDED